MRSLRDLWASLEDLRGGLVLVLLEVFVEQLAEFGDLVFEVGGTGPGLLGIEKLVWDVGTPDRHV